MSAGMGDEFKEQVRSHTNLVDLVSETIGLTPRSGNYVGLCPFHDDKNPSLNVYPDRQSYRCWSCNVGGDCFTWVQEIQKVSFPEALEVLATRANLEIPKRSEAVKKSEHHKSTQYEIVDWAVSLMQQALRTGEAGEIARSYFQARRLSAETIRNFRLGYHPENWTWLQDRARQRYSEKQLLSVGLIGEKQNGHGFYDNLVGRVVFPILDESGRPVAFGGRVLPGGNIESPAKYWNSPESNIFLKRKTLYGFTQARDAIRQSKSAVVVEGYMDCLACHQAGVSNVVATLGTAMTEDHVRLLKRFATNVVLCYDGDRAGREAAEKSISRFLALDLDLRILTPSDGQDPADFLETHTAEDFNALVKAAPEAWEYKLQAIIDRFGLDSIHGRELVLKEMMEFIALAPGMHGSVREALIIRTVCGRIQTEERTAIKLLKETRAGKNRIRRVLNDAENDSLQPEPVFQPSTGQEKAERELLEILLTYPELISYVRHHVGAGDFVNAQHQQLLELCFDVAEEGDLPGIVEFVAAADSNSTLVSLINAVCDSAQEKGICALMSELLPGDELTGETKVPPHLERVLNPLLIRRGRNQNLLSKHRMAQAQSSPSELNSDAIETLRRISTFRKNEMGNPSSTK